MHRRQKYQFIVWKKKENLPISDTSDWLEGSIKVLEQGTEKKHYKFLKNIHTPQKWPPPHPKSEIILRFMQIEITDDESAWMQSLLKNLDQVFNIITDTCILHFTTGIISVYKSGAKI